MMSDKKQNERFQVDALEERIAPSTLSVGQVLGHVASGNSTDALNTNHLLSDNSTTTSAANGNAASVGQNSLNAMPHTNLDLGGGS